jgi:hypothetical protein
VAAAALAASFLSACGGGAGNAPPPIGGHGPTPHPTSGASTSPSPKPTATPTSSPTPAATPTPAPTSTPASAGGFIASTSGRFGLTQVLDWTGSSSVPPMSASEIQSEAPHYDSVWGAFEPSTWLAANSHIVLSLYTLPVEDDNMVSGNTLAYFQTNHPDWILYACNSSDGSPTHDLAWSTSTFPDVPLAFYLPQVQQFQMQTLIPYLKSHGYAALGADNTDLVNYLYGETGVGGQGGNTGEYGCGTYDAQGNFHRRYGTAGAAYTSSDRQNDSQFASDMVGWIGETSSALHAAGLKLVINHPMYNSPTNPNEQQIAGYADAELDENGYTNLGRGEDTGSAFAHTLQWVEYLQSLHKAILLSDYFCDGSTCQNPSSPSSLSAQQVDWALASYAIGNEGAEDVYISATNYAQYSYRPEYSTTYGAACAPYSVSSGIYARKFQGALAVVNASGFSQSYALPSNHTYTDIEGRSASGTLSLAPADGYFLLTSNGCN